MTVAIASLLLERLAAMAAASPDVEICGLLTGPGARRIAAIAPAANVAFDPARAFEIDPAVLFAAIRAERAGGPRVVGHYHSHPGGDAQPSPRDAEAAGPAGVLWLILGRDARLWRSVPGGPVLGAFEPVALVAAPDAIARSDASRHKGVELGQPRG